MDAHKARKNPCKPKNLLKRLVEEKVREVLATNVPAIAPSAPSIPIVVKNVSPFLKWVGGRHRLLMML